jgi:hypothetical protein
MSQAPGTAIPDPAEVAGWTMDDVIAYLQPELKNWKETDRKIFTEANILGKLFLNLADPKYEGKGDLGRHHHFRFDSRIKHSASGLFTAAR